MRLLSLSLIPVALNLLLQSVPACSATWVPFDTTQFKRHATIETPSKKAVELYWTLSDDLETITIGVASNSSSGWLAVGFAERPGMKGADIALSYVNADGKFVLEDRFTEDYVKPVLDARQNLNLTAAWHSGTSTAFIFSRATKSSCIDQDRDLFVTPYTQQNVIVAFGNSMIFEQHSPNDRAAISVDLASPTDRDGQMLASPPIDNLDLIPIDIFAPPTTVLAKETTYCYSYFELPDQAKYHVIQEIPMITDPRIHHMMIYACDRPRTDMFNATSPKFICDIPTPCVRFFAGWAPGISNRTYPQEYAKAVGLGDASQKYFVLEVHYSQADPIVFTDNSGPGFRLMASKTLRDHDIGELAIGMDPESVFEIPAGRKYSLTYEFPFECSKRLNQTVTILGTYLHMHKRGHSGEVSIIRRATNRSELLLGLNYFDFNNQGQTHHPRTTLSPGDRIQITCTWDSTNIPTPTKGGYSSDEEMCYAFIEYYPYQNVQLGWRWPYIFDDAGNVTNIVSGLDGNFAQCEDGTLENSFIPIAPFQSPIGNENPHAGDVCADNSALAIQSVVLTAPGSTNVYTFMIPVAFVSLCAVVGVAVWIHKRNAHRYEQIEMTNALL